MFHSFMTLAYLGPETMLPMTSIIAGVVGVLMMFGRNSIRWVVSGFRALTGRSGATAAGSRPSRKIGAGPVGGIVRPEPSSKSEVEG